MPRSEKIFHSLSQGKEDEEEEEGASKGVRKASVNNVIPFQKDLPTLLYSLCTSYDENEQKSLPK